MKTEAQIDSAPSEACSYVLACPCPEGYGSGDYAPRTRFPELREIAGESGDNAIHGSLRDIFLAAGLDAGRYGSQQWNPLGQWIAPGMRVLIKPNWVKHETGENETPDLNIPEGSRIERSSLLGPLRVSFR